MKPPITKKPMRDTVASLFAQFSGQQNVLTIPRPYIDLCNGDHLQALLLSQIIYWGDRTSDPDGWFAKSYADWETELGMTEYQVRRAITGDKRAKVKSIPLSDLGVETKVAQSPFYGSKPTVHYRINFQKLSDSILNNVRFGTLTMSSLDTQQSKVSSYTETTTETIAKTTDKENTLRATRADAPASVVVQEPSTPISKPSSENEKKAERPKNPLQEAVCFAFYLKPGGYAGKLGKWLTGGSVEGEEYQRYPIEEPATPEEIVGWRLWLEDKYDDADKAKRFRPQKIKGIHESFEDHFRGAADHEKWLKKGAKQLDRLLGIQRVVFEPAPDVRPPLAVNVPAPATPDNDDFESFNAEIEAGVAELVRIFSDHAGASNEKDRAYLLARKQAYLESQQKRAG